MAKFSPEQTQAVIEVQQLIHDWAHELDVNNGLHVAELVTEDCVYVVRGAPRQGRAEVQKFYQERLTSLSSQATGIPTQRHILSNLRVDFRSAVEVSISFGLIYFTTAGVAAGADRADPAAVADVRMDCRRDGDGHWRIAKFDSEQIFRRVAT